MSDRAPYSRVYWTVRTDPKFVGIYSHDGHLATWLRLLIAADATWPAPADLPASARKASLRALSEAGLIDLLPDGLFKVHGLDAERGRRRDAAQESANARRSVSERSANGQRPVPERSARRDELRRDETSRDEHTARDGLRNLDREAIRALEDRTGRPWSLAGDRQLGEYDRLIQDHGLTAVIGAFDAVSGGKTLTARQLIWPAMKLLEPMPSQPKVEVPAETGPSRGDQIYERMVRRRMEHYQQTGVWDPSWGPAPEAVA